MATPYISNPASLPIVGGHSRGKHLHPNLTGLGPREFLFDYLQNAWKTMLRNNGPLVLHTNLSFLCFEPSSRRHPSASEQVTGSGYFSL
jgi:hypothetical protein